jgi:protein ImuB
MVSAAIAGTSVCARTLKRYEHGRIVRDGEEAEVVKPLPLFALGADEAIIRGLHRAGLKTVGDVAAREPHEITARFGAAFTALVQKALGQGDAPINPRKPVPDYMAERRFAEPVATDEVITQTLAKLAHMLVMAMDRQGKGARRLEATFFRTDGAVRAIAVDAGRPVTRANFIERLFREKLDALNDPLDPGFGFDLIRLAASRVETVVQEQRDFDTHAQDNDEVAALIDRIAARIGGHRIIVHLPQDTHIPERAMVSVPAQQSLDAAGQATWPERIEAEPPLRPLRLLERPEEIRVTAMFPDGPPAQFEWRRKQHRISRVEGPERIAMEWWRSIGDALKNEATRDYFRVENREGGRFWLYRQGIYRREVTSFRWFMHGMFA